MDQSPVILPEQTALIGAGPGDAFWSGRFDDTDEVAAVGETFLLNALVTPAKVATTGLVPHEAREGLGRWLAGLHLRAEDGVAAVATEPRPEAPVMEIAALSALAGLPLGELPPPYAAWRYTTEIYVVHGRAVYAVNGPLAIRTKLLTEAELGIAFGRRLLPLVDDWEERGDALVFLVAVPARAAALGGLRGQRLALIAAGEGKEALARMSGPRSWLWETEFYDDAAARVLGVDGLERVPLVVGVAPGEES